MRASRRAALALLCCLLWGSAAPCIKLSMGLFGIPADAYASQILVAGARFTLAGLGAIIAGSLLAKRPLFPSREEAKAAAFLCLFQTIGQYVIYYIGVSNASGVHASVVQSTNVCLAFLIACFVLRQEKFTAVKLAGCLVGCAGILVMYAGSLHGQGSFTFLGEGLVLLSTICAATSTCLLKRLSGRFSPAMLSAYQFLYGGLVMLGGGILAGGTIPSPVPAGFGLLAYLAFVSAAAYALWGYLLQRSPTVSAVSVFGCTTPMFGTLLSCLLLGEREALGWNVLAGLGCAVVSVLLVNREGSRRGEQTARTVEEAG